MLSKSNTLHPFVSDLFKDYFPKIPIHFIHFNPKSSILDTVSASILDN